MAVSERPKETVSLASASEQAQIHDPTAHIVAASIRGGRLPDWDVFRAVSAASEVTIGRLAPGEGR